MRPASERGRGAANEAAQRVAHLARVAIAVAEEGTDLSRVAFEHWRALLKAPKRKRDWAKELAKDRAVNEELFKGLKGEF